MHYMCPRCGDSTIMVKDRKSGRWHSCSIGTTSRHRCQQKASEHRTPPAGSADVAVPTAESTQTG